MSSDSPFELDSERPSENRIATFIRKLYTMLEESLHPEIFDWTEDGESIIIKKPTEFGGQLLPKYFKHNRITSFIRQLNMYNFQKKRSRNAEHIYSHDLFKRGQKHMLIQIKRKVKEGFLPNQHPNFALLSTSDSSSGELCNLVNENRMLKSLQDQTATKIQLLEEKLMELTAENQSLHQQVQQQTGKHNYMMEAFLKMRLENNNSQPYIYNDRANEEGQLGHKLVVTKSAILRNNSNQEPLPDGKIPTLQGADTSALYGNAYMGGENKLNAQNLYDQTGRMAAQMRQPLKPIVNNVTGYDPLYYSMGKEGDAMLENYRSSMMADYNNNINILGKRAVAQLEEERRLYGELEGGDLTKRFAKNPAMTNEERAGLNIADIKKLRQGFFSSIGDKEYENTFDTEIDLLCFQ